MKSTWLFLLALALTQVSPALAQNPGLQIGGASLEPALRTQRFTTLFTSTMGLNVMVATKAISAYRFVITDNGLFCPMRKTDPHAEYEFFSNFIQNSACLDLNLFAQTPRQLSVWQSARNSVPLLVKGNAEKPGKEINMIAEASDVILDQKSVIGATLSLDVAGKTYATEIRRWLTGTARINVRLLKGPTGWKIFYLEGNAWVPFTAVKNNVSIGNTISTFFSGHGTQSDPIPISAGAASYR